VKLPDGSVVARVPLSEVKLAYWVEAAS
jgi:hypothetical protein